MITRTHTRTVHSIDFANPFLACDQCGQLVEYAEGTEEGEGPVRNQPCDHQAGVTSRCPSWSPVDGCRCQEHVGHVPHAA